MCAKSTTGAPIKIRAFKHILISCTFTFSVSWRDNSLHCRRVLLMTPSCCCVHACNTTMYSLSRRHVLLPTQCQVVREEVRCKQTKSTLKEPRRICKRNPLGCAGCQAQTLPGSLCVRWGDVKYKDDDDINQLKMLMMPRPDANQMEMMLPQPVANHMEMVMPRHDAARFRTHLVCRLPGSTLAW